MSDSIYFLTKDKKLEIHHKGDVYSAKIPLRFTLSLMQHLKNFYLKVTRHPERLHAYALVDQKDDQVKLVYLTHKEIQNVWNRPIKMTKPTKIVKKGKRK